MSAASAQGLRELLGGIDVYLLDQIQRGRIGPGARIFDAGFGSGRNLVWFLRAGHPVAGCDADPRVLAGMRALAAELAPELAREAFSTRTLEDLAGMPGGGATADVVVCNAVLHFARDDAQFDAMLDGAWSVLAPGGLFFARLTSSIGIEERVRPLQGRWCGLPDGSERYLVDEALLLRHTARLGAELLDPIKTTNVQGLRCMTTWVLRRGT